MVTIDEVRSYALSLPETEEIEHWGKPSFRIKNKIFAVIQEDGIYLTVRTTMEDRSVYTTMDPEAFKIPESFSNLNYMLVNITLVDPQELKGFILKAWCSIAPKRIVKKYFESQNEVSSGGS